MDDTTTILVPRRNIPEALFALLFQVPSTWILIASTLRVWTPSGEGKSGLSPPFSPSGGPEFLLP